MTTLINQESCFAPKNANANVFRCRLSSASHVCREPILCIMLIIGLKSVVPLLVCFLDYLSIGCWGTPGRYGEPFFMLITLFFN